MEQAFGRKRVKKKIRRLLMTGIGSALLAASCSGSPGGGCRTDNDCPSGRYCAVLSGECIFDCVYSSDCPAGYRCTGRGKCEPGCSITHGGIEDCDNIDNDCDGQTDEDVPPRDCEKKNLYGTCRGQEACLDHAWVCDALVPAQEKCDGADNDCDGTTDEGFDTGQSCPGAGVCPDGVWECAPDGSARCSTFPGGSDDRSGPEVCNGLDDDCDGATDDGADPTYLPESGGQAVDGLDNNCNGLVDERGGVLVRFKPSSFPDTYMTAYEIGVFENPDCTGRQYGLAGDDYPAGWPAGPESPSVTLYACALPGIYPSGHLSWYRAQRACAAQGMRLCAQAEWIHACQDGRLIKFPYGTNHIPHVCNDGWNEDGVLARSGEFSTCSAGNHIFDMVGNLAEWVEDASAKDPRYHLAGSGAYQCLICTLGVCLHPCDRQDPAAAEAYLDWASCLLQDNGVMMFLPNQVDFFLGGRCCRDRSSGGYP